MAPYSLIGGYFQNWRGIAPFVSLAHTAHASLFAYDDDLPVPPVDSRTRVAWSWHCRTKCKRGATSLPDIDARLHCVLRLLYGLRPSRGCAVLVQSCDESAHIPSNPPKENYGYCLAKRSGEKFAWRRRIWHALQYSNEP